MTTALILIGRLDTFETLYSTLKEYIIDPLQPDIFFSGYPNLKGLEYCENKILDLWKPKKYILREYNQKVRQEVHPNDTKFTRSHTAPPKISSWLSGIYNVKMANNLKLEYEKQLNFKYDICIKARTDLLWYNNISAEEIELAKQPNNILIPAAWNFSQIHPLGASDVTAISNSESMNIYSSLIDNIDRYYDSGEYFHPESLLGIHIHKHGLNRINITGGWDPFTKIPNETGWAVVDTNPDRRELKNGTHERN